MRKRVFTFLSVVLMIFAAIGGSITAQASGTAEFYSSRSSQNKETVRTARPSTSGRLHVEDKCLVDSFNQVIQLRGVSTHGLTWYPEYIDEKLFAQLSEDWNCNFIRLAMYASVYCDEDPEGSYALMKQGIDYAVKNDMYVLVDWHMLEKGDPNEQIDGATEFFDRITKEYADCPNLIFEICNEPNGNADWSDVLRYANHIIPVIRENIPEAVIVVGTPEFDKNLAAATLRPLYYDNVMYVLHFYAATHGKELQDELIAAVNSGLPVFISECGICEADGDGDINFEMAAKWFSYLNSKKISYCIWSFSDKDESSAFFKNGFDPKKGIDDEDLSTSGLFVRELIRGGDPEEIPVPAPIVKKHQSDYVKTWITGTLGERGYEAVYSWSLFFAIAAGVIILSFIIALIYNSLKKKRQFTYNDVVGGSKKPGGKKAIRFFSVLCLLLSTMFTLIYLMWRIRFSIPSQYGPLPIIFNIILLAVEILGFMESLILYRNLFGKQDYELPEIPDDAWPEVDIFIATYNEPEELLKKTINGCKHLKYPDRSKVHVWVCDDNRRASMRALAEKMGVGYFDRPDNKGAKAGNLNNALRQTSAPYVVTLDADMIVKSDFLLKTIPYFVDVQIREQDKPEGEKHLLGLLQTPQCFYDPDVFQYALYAERRAPNEQDFFYRTIEPSKTSTNSVIYGGSNTVISRAALDAIGGFYTESITEDFATGLLIESAGFISLGLPEPLASGQTPHTFREHIKQRTRWGRGVIATARQLRIFGRRNLTIAQKVSYLSSVVYWYSPVKNLVYMISPLLFAVFAIPVFECNWLELVVFWLPMFFIQDINLRVNSKNAISTKWSGIYETGVMPHLFIPIVQEALGLSSMKKFKVTDKTANSAKRVNDTRAMAPFLILILLSVIGLIRLIVIFEPGQTISFIILAFWLIRNMYFLLMSVFLVNGRDSDGEVVRVYDTELCTVSKGPGSTYEGVTTMMTEHNLSVYPDEGGDMWLGDHVDVTLMNSEAEFKLSGVITGINESSSGRVRVYTIEILDFCGNEDEYLQILYDRIPTLPQSLNRDFGVIPHLWQNIAHRVARTRRK